MREYQKQKEELSLLEIECTLEWTSNAIRARKAKASRLHDEVSKIHQYLETLEDEKRIILKDLSQENAWIKFENQRQTLKLLEINSE